ncbi:MAG: FliM/FliN family flagellar motor switch protein [Blastocatellia bacterium]|nr:FliM/FliN family flagellar motor switch protein [Blastocatellia bacterium]
MSVNLNSPKMKRISPFKFINLPKVPQERVELSKAMSNCLPGMRWEETFRELISNTLRKYIRGKKQLTLNFQITSEDGTENFERSFNAVEKESILIGRNPACDVHLNNRVVSSQHARILMEKGRLLVIDQSANGTGLNGKLIKSKTPTPLTHADTISIYPYQIVFTLGQTVLPEETQIEFKVDNVCELSFSEVIKKLSAPVPLLVIGVEPMGYKALVEIEPNFIIGITDLIFGSESGLGSKILRTLSNIETGVIEFLALRTIKAMSSTMSEFSGITLRLEQLLVQGGQTLKNPEVIAEPNEPVLEVTTRFAIADSLTYLNLYLPYKLLKETSHQKMSMQNQIELLSRWMPAVETTKTELVAEIGEIKLSSQELLQLEPSDIILLQEVRVRLYGTELSGEMDIRLGVWGEICFKSDIIAEEGSVKVILNSITKNPRVHQTEYFRSIEATKEKRTKVQTDPGVDTLNQMTGEANRRTKIDSFGTATRGDHRGDVTEEADFGETTAKHVRDYADRDGEESMAEHEENIGESAEFVQAVPVTLIVELGRRSMTIADITRLRIGQIVDLQRTPSEPVDLTIDGKVIGRGELVDIDGELGVRILRLFR